MIKSYLATVLLLASLCSYSQDNKNKFMINGGIGYSHWKKDVDVSRYSTTKSSAPSFHGSTHLGYFVSDKLALGLFGSLSGFEEKSKFGTGTLPYPTAHTTEYRYSGRISTMGLFARYQQLIIDNKFGFLFQAHLASDRFWSNSWQYYSDPTNGDREIRNYSRSKGQYIDLTAGLIYYINKKFSLETTFAGLNFGTRNIQTDYTKIKTRGGQIDLYSSVNLAFTYYFGFSNK